MSVLPGEDVVDRQLVEGAVRRINRAFDAHSLHAMTDVGRFVLDTFFAGDMERFRHRGRRHRSFDALADHRHLLPSRVALWRAVSVCDQLRHLPPELADGLPFTHHTLLLAVHDPAQKLALARTAIAERWSRRRLEAEVRALTDETKRSRGGRPRLLPVVRTLNRMERLALGPAAFEGADRLPTLPSAERRRLASIVELATARLAEVGESLKSVVVSPMKPSTPVHQVSDTRGS